MYTTIYYEPYDTCIYYKINGVDILIVAIFVDYLLIFSNKAESKLWIKTQSFKMIDNGPEKFILGHKHIWSQCICTLREIVQLELFQSININIYEKFRNVLIWAIAIPDAHQRIVMLN